MKTSIYFTVLFLMFSSLYADETAYMNSSQTNETSSSTFSVSALDFDKKDTVVPGVTIDLTSKTSVYNQFKVTLARNFFKTATSIVENVNPMETTLYAQISFRF